MKRMILMVLMLLVCGNAFANKIYYDTAKNLEVCDISEKKTIEQINAEYSGSFIDITEARRQQEMATDLAAKDKADLEKAGIAQKTEELRIKLNLTKQEMDDLKKIMRTL